MRFRKVGTCEAMKDKEMHDRLQHRDDQCVLKEKCGEIIYDAKWFYEWSLCNKKRHDICDKNQLLQAINKSCFLLKIFVIQKKNHFSIRIDHLCTWKKLSANLAWKLVRHSKKNITCRKKYKCGKVKIKCVFVPVVVVHLSLIAC
jgi:hypothetical protein